MANASTRRFGGNTLGTIALTVLAFLIGSFSAFVGWNKALAPLDVLAQHSAWTYHLPELLGRAIGWLEMLAVSLLWLGLAIRKLAWWGVWAAVWITLNHAVAGLVHVLFAEWHTLPQSAVLLTLCTIMIALYRRHARSASTEE